MPLPLAYVAGLAVLNAGRVALPWAARALWGASGTALRATTSIATRKLTVGGAVALSAAPFAVQTALSVAEHESGGLLSETAINGAISAIKASNLTYENLESHIDKAAYIAEISNVIDKAIQNQAVLHVLGDSDKPDQEKIKLAKDTSIGAYMAQGAPALIAKNMVRRALVDDVIDDKDTADKYLAENLVDDIVEGAQVRALRDTPVTHEDVKAHIAELLNSDKGNYFITDRLRNGFAQMWPDLFEQPKPETQPSATQSAQPGAAGSAAARQTASGLAGMSDGQINALKGKSLSSLFDQATDLAKDTKLDLGWQFNLSTMAIGLLSMINFNGWADNIIDNMKRHVVDMVQDEVINQGPNLFNVSDSKEHDRHVERQAKPGMQPV
jgi:hypothetical protein